MSSLKSPATGRRYGVERVCRTFEYPRSTFYDAARPKGDISPSSRRGPKPAVDDSRLLALIKADLERSLFKGEGHRKVWARLRVLDGVRVGKQRVLRVMRENNLLSPGRIRQSPPVEHTGRIVTDGPNVMWGSDGSKVYTLDEGWVWVFSAVEHWNMECVGWHVCKKGDRYAALEPFSAGLKRIFGHVGEGVATGLKARIDHGSQYTSDHFINQLRFWGIEPSFAFVNEPETNGVVERFNRTLKEQAVYGRIFRNVEEVRRAVGRFIEQYNAQWRVEKLGYLTPVEARKNYAMGVAA